MYIFFRIRSPYKVYSALSDGHFRRGVQEADRQGGDVRVPGTLLVKHHLSIEALCLLFNARWARIKSENPNLVRATAFINENNDTRVVHLDGVPSVLKLSHSTGWTLFLKFHNLAQQLSFRLSKIWQTVEQRN